MMTESTYISVDLGATSGRVMLGAVASSGVRIEEVHRFPTRTITQQDGLHWDIRRLHGEILTGVENAIARGSSPRGIAFDTWGVDYGLISDSGRLLAAPFHHRDARTAGRAEELDADFLYGETGIQTQSINTLVQLLSERPDGPLSAAASLLFMPDLLGYLFSGVQATERTIASTSQLLTANGDVSARILDRYHLPNLLGKVTEPGSLLGPSTPQIRARTGFSGLVLSVAGHDTASAVAALPVTDDQFAFISCGTWALVGFELKTPVLTEMSRRAGFTNERGVDGTYRYLRNVTGLWLLTESLRSWDEPTTAATTASLVESASTCTRFRSLIDPLDPVFLAPGDIPQRIRTFCESTSQPVPVSPAEIARCILDSLALSFADAVARGSAITGITPTAIHIVGGGSHIEDLCSALADISGIRVMAGPAEATALGNILMQARALGELNSLAQIRATVTSAAGPREYIPRPLPIAHSVRERFAGLVGESADVL